MRWVYKVGDELMFADADDDGSLSCASDLKRAIDQLVMFKVMVNCAELGFLMEASLDSPAQIWGTVSAAIGELPNARLVVRPPNRVGYVEMVNTESSEYDMMEKAQFASRSEAGRYAAHIRWSRQSGVEPLTPDEWRARQGGSTGPVSEPSKPGKMTPTGRDWDEEPPVFQTMQEGLDWLNAKWGDPSKPGSRFTATGSAPDWVRKDFVAAMDNMFREMPEVCLSIASIYWGDKEGVKNVWGWAGRSSSPYVGFANLTWSRTAMKPSGEYDAYVSVSADVHVPASKQQAYESGQKSTPSVSATFYHEVGHQLLNMAGNIRLHGDKMTVKSSIWAEEDDAKAFDRECAKLISPVIRKVFPSIPGRARLKLGDLRNTEVEKSVSKYALTNYQEFAAECVAQYFAGKFEPSKGYKVSPIAIAVTEELLRVVREGSKA